MLLICHDFLCLKEKGNKFNTTVELYVVSFPTKVKQSKDISTTHQCGQTLFHCSLVEAVADMSHVPSWLAMSRSLSDSSIEWSGLSYVSYPSQNNVNNFNDVVVPSRELDVAATLPGSRDWCWGLCFVKKGVAT
jgi:hypothetical protein